MELRTIRGLDVSGKRVLLRADFNVPVRGGRVTYPLRIERTVPTIEMLRSGGAALTIISHRTGKEPIAPIKTYLEEHIGSDGVELLENVRLLGNEEGNDPAFAKALASRGDIFVNDAFGALHREHASIVGVPNYLPSYAGLLVEEEVRELGRAFHPEHPFLLILGGVKFQSKVGVLNRFLDIADDIFIGGALARSFSDERVDAKIILPRDGVPKNGAMLDVGPESVALLKGKIAHARFIVWNGPLGGYERGFGEGTTEVARAVAASPAHAIIGGGNTLEAVRGISFPNAFLSTGGGAMLAFLARGSLAGLEPLKA